MKVLDVSTVNTDFKWYHKITMWRYRRKALQMFRDKATIAVKSKQDYVDVHKCLPELPWSHGIKERAAQAGIDAAVAEITAVYPQFKRSTGLFWVWAWDLLTHKEQEEQK